MIVNEAKKIIIKYKIEDINNIDYSNLVNLYVFLGELLSDKKFDIYSKILELANMDKINEALIIGLLRLSYSRRKDIYEWNLFIEKAKLELRKRNHNVDELLSGLI